MDAIDKQLINVLQKEGKLTMKELSSRLELSITPVYERVRRLERNEVITGYHAEVDATKIGLGLEAFCSVTLDSHKIEYLLEFEEEIQKFDEVLECYHMAGSYDFLVKIIVTDMDAYGEFINKKLASMKSIGLVNSHMVLKKIKRTNVLPITS